MRIYCFEIEGEPDWSSEKPVLALDQRTGHQVLIYRSRTFDHGLPDACGRARTIVEGLAPTAGNSASVHLFSFGKHIGLTAPDEHTAAPVLRELRSRGIFPVPALAPPPRVTPCAKCGKRHDGDGSLCAVCIRARRSPEQRQIIAAAVLLVSLAGLFLLVRAYNRPKLPPQITFYANPTRVAKGQTAVLTWRVENASSVSIVPGIGQVSVDASRQVLLARTTTYTLTASGPGGKLEQRVTVEVSGKRRTTLTSPAPLPQPAETTIPAARTGPTRANPPPTFPPVPISSRATRSPSTPNSPSTQNTPDTRNPPDTQAIFEPLRQIPTVPPPPSVQLVTSGSAVHPGDPVTLTWTSANAANVSITPQPGRVQLSGSWSTSLASSTIFTLTATGPGGDTTRSVTINVVPRTPAYSAQPVYGRPNLPAVPLAGSIVWTGQVNALTHKVSITWILVKGTNGSLWRAVSPYAGQVQQGASIFDPQADIFGNRAQITSVDRSVQIVDSQFDGRSQPPFFTLTLHCDEAGQQTIALRWTKRGFTNSR